MPNAHILDPRADLKLNSWPVTVLSKWYRYESCTMFGGKLLRSIFRDRKNRPTDAAVISNVRFCVGVLTGMVFTDFEGTELVLEWV
jgi:hypothetical protein